MARSSSTGARVPAAHVAAEAAAQVAARRFASQLLTDPLPAATADAARVSVVVEAVGRILGVQAQDLRGMRLAVRSRTTGLTVTDVDRAFAERKIVVTWLNRKTLHLVRAEDYGWLHALTAPRQESFLRKRLAEEGVSPSEAERGISLVERALAAEGPQTRSQLRDLLDGERVRVERQALIMILAFASRRGVLVRGPMVGTEQAYVLAEDWLGDLAAPAVTGREVDRDAALASLATRYLAGHGPADERDLAVWSGLPLGDTRRGFALAAEAKAIQTLDDRWVVCRRSSDVSDASGADALAAHSAAGAGQDGGGVLDEVGRELPPPRLLGPFDPVLHGWASRDWVTGPHRGIVTVNGIFRPIALVAGQAVATWAMPAGKVVLSPLTPLTPETTAALHAQAADVERFLSHAGADDKAAATGPVTACRAAGAD